MSAIRPHVLVIAGLDPSSGAGLLADIKTLEINKVYGFGVCSALTRQNDKEFYDVEWLNAEMIIGQIEVLVKKYSFGVVKIGLIQVNNSLACIIDYLLKLNKDVKIIWDPVLKASSGFVFHNTLSYEFINEITAKTYLITPNIYEARILTNNSDHINQALLCMTNNINTKCSILLKGGHSPDNIKNDILFSGGKQIILSGEAISGYDKHGTGCVLSSAVAAGLSLGKSLEQSCRDAKEYTRKFILSNKTLLGYHHE
jgi:hydroxymethylpyrimidine/phosphomethylpyrimidine kinase